MEQLKAISKNLSEIWNFAIYADKANHISLTVGNLIIALFLIIMGQKIAKRISIAVAQKV